MKKVTIKISGMTCAGCSSALEKYLNKQEGIEKAEVNLVMSNAAIEYDEKNVDINKIDEYVKQAGFKSLGIDKFELEKNNLKKEKLKLAVTIILALILMGISIIKILDADLPGLTIISNPKVYVTILGFLATIIIITSISIIRDGIKKLLHKIPNMHSLIAIGVVTSYLYSIYSLIMTLFVKESYANKTYFESAAMVLVFTNIGRYIDNKSKIKTKEAITKLMTITPSKATIIRDEYEVRVNIDEINKGDIVICKPGEKIAVDGKILNGYTHIDESFITGESMPADKKQGDKVLAGSINLDGYIEYIAEKIGRETAVSEIVKMVVSAVNSKAPISKLADKVCLYFVPAIIVIAIISFIVWLIIGETVMFAINIFVSVLVVACPCALGLATPMATTIANGTGVKKGILIKNNKVLEEINKIDTVVLDKTGTITEGMLNVCEICKYGLLSENGILQLVGTIERKSEHPIAKAIVQRCSTQGIKLGQVREIEILPGKGVRARYKGEDILIGNKKLMVENKIEINEEDAERLSKAGNILVFVSVDNKLVSTIGLSDKVKSSAKEMVQSLKNKNLEIVMLTGDSEKTAGLVGEEVDIQNIIASVLPSEKVKKIEELRQKNKKVIMVGDGINDAPSLVTADIGISMQGATDIAIDSSDVVIMDSDLSKINMLFNLSRKTLIIIKQNLCWAFAYNIIMIPIACGMLSKLNLLLNPMYASFAMIISSIIVILNSLRLNK